MIKAALLTQKQVLQVCEIPEPDIPVDGLILKVDACGVCGSDLRRWKEGPDGAPIIPGHEIAGEVLSVGPELSGYKPGDRLAIAPDVHCGKCYYCRRGRFNLCDNIRMLGITPGYPGGFAQQMALTGDILRNGILHRVPEGLSQVEAAFAEPCSSVLAAHQNAGTSPADTVVVLGGGPIGCLHLVVARARGARTILSEPSQIRREMAGPFLPDAVIDPLTDNVLDRVRELTDGLGADIVICANPIAQTQTQAVEMVRKGGRVVLFGGLPKANPMTSLDGNRIHYGEIQVSGSFSYHPTFHEMALEAIQRKLIPTQSLISDTFPLEDIQAAFEKAADGSALKVMIHL